LTGLGKNKKPGTEKEKGVLKSFRHGQGLKKKGRKEEYRRGPQGERRKGVQAASGPSRGGEKRQWKKFSQEKKKKSGGEKPPHYGSDRRLAEKQKKAGAEGERKPGSF